MFPNRYNVGVFSYKKRHEVNFILSYLNNLFIYQVLCALIYRRRSLYSFLLKLLVFMMQPGWCWFQPCRYGYYSVNINGTGATICRVRPLLMSVNVLWFTVQLASTPRSPSRHNTSPLPPRGSPFLHTQPYKPWAAYKHLYRAGT